jgi:shikimate kinase
MERIALIGYRGSGKSTVGPLLATKLRWRFVDADASLETKLRKSIARIFAEDGEGAFRDLESHYLAVCLREDKIVLATGGGVILRAINCERLKGAAFVVWLDASADTCWQRIQADPVTAARRPNLTASGGFDEVARILAERRGLYEATAQLRVNADESPEAAADAILQAWHSRRATESC